jgi:hypothetical protein
MNIILLLVTTLLLAGCGSSLTVFAPPNTAESALETPEIFAFNRLEGSAGDEVLVTGIKFNSGMTAVIGQTVVPLNFVTKSSATFKIPEGISSDLTNIKFFSASNEELKSSSLLIHDAVSRLPVIAIDRSFVCSSTDYIDPQGNPKTGTRNCAGEAKSCSQDGELGCQTNKDFAAVDAIAIKYLLSSIEDSVQIAGLKGTLPLCKNEGDSSCVIRSGLAALDALTAAAKIIAGQSIAGISGLAQVRSPDCSAESQLNCVTGARFKSADISSFTSADIKISETILNKTGLLQPSPADCNAEGQINCRSTVDFPAFDSSIAASKILVGQNLGAVSGSAAIPSAVCTADGQISCITSTNFPSIDRLALASNSSKIRSGLTLGSVSGTLVDCSSDGGHSCVVVGPSFAAANATGLSAKILSGQSLAGVTGSAPLRPRDCGSDGDLSCVTVTNYPAVVLAQITANQAKIRSSLSIAGINGTAEDCQADGDQSCVAIGPQFRAMALSGASAKILDGETLGGVTGSVIKKPIDCSIDGELACASVSSFPAALASGAASKIAMGQILAGITGSNSSIEPSACATDAEISCTANSSFRAMLKSTAAAKIALGDSLAGVLGTASVRPSECAADAQTSCVANSSFPAVLKTTLATNAAKFQSGYAIAGVNGTLPTCASDGSQGCVATASFPAALSTGAGAKVLTGSTLAGISGSASPKPLNCSSDNQTNCVTTASYPAIDKTILTASTGSFRSSLSLVTVSGTLGLCAADGATSCLTNANYPAAESNAAAAKILSGQSLAGISGAADIRPADCATDGDIACVASTGYRAALIAGADAKILSGQSVAGISGSAPIRPADCGTDGASNCVAVSNYPAIDKVSKLSNANLLKIRSGLSIAAVAGQMNDCSTDGQQGCYALASNPAAVVAGAQTKILSGQTLAGVNGNVPVRPLDCSADNQTACVSLSTFPAIELNTLTNNAAKIRSGTTFLGTSGILVNCSSDNQTNCVTVPAYPSISSANVVGSVKSGASILGLTGAYPSATYPLASDTAVVDLTNFGSQMVSDNSFEFFDSNGSRYAASGDADLKAINLRSAKVLENLSITGTMATIQMRAPGPLTEVFSSSPSNRITLNWQNIGATTYLLVRKPKGPVDWVPAPGSSYSTGAQGTSNILYIGTDTMYIDTTIDTTSSYHYAVYAFDGNYNYSEVARVSDMLNLCAAATVGGTWVAVPGDLAYASPDFCVMKYHAKNISNVATSQAANPPWSGITQENSVSRCQALGSKYNLISNRDYLVIGSNMIDVASNWSGGVVGKGTINRGHTDNSPMSTCPASSNDSLAWLQSNCTNLDSTGDTWLQKRTHSLSTGSVVWDFGGNMWTWTSLIPNWMIKPYKAADNGPVSSWRDLWEIDTNFGSLSRAELLPLHSTNIRWNSNWDRNQSIGAYQAGTHGMGGIVLRGSAWNEQSNGGIFTVNLLNDRSTAVGHIGFRCTYYP